MKRIIVLALTALILLMPIFAQGQTETTSSYPEKGITMIVPYPAGGTTDVSGRKFAALLSKELGVSVTVVNRQELLVPSVARLHWMQYRMDILYSLQLKALEHRE